jgi:uncharacterized protein
MVEMTSLIAGATDMALSPAGQRAGADSGDPQVSSRTISNENDIHVGVWECAPGGWPVIDRPDTEIATIISGSGVITSADGSKQNVTPGTVVTLPKGWTGRWDITETVRKVYVIVA